VNLAAALRIAQTYSDKLKRPLKAAETYQEVNFARGGNDREAQDAIFRIGSQLKQQKRWVEALHVLAAMDEQTARSGEPRWRPSQWTAEMAT